MNLYTYLLLFCLSLFFACKKEITPPGGDKEPPINEEDERIKERIYYYYNQQSLWTDDIPDRDKEEREAFVKRYSSNNELLSALKRLTPFHRGYGGSIDRFSFLDESDSEGNLSYADGFRMDTNEGYGLYFSWGRLSSAAMVAYPVIDFVEGGSPAQEGGLTRGAIVYAINDDESITVALNDEGDMMEPDQQRIERKLKSALEAHTLKLKVETVDGDEMEYMLHYETYNINPIVADTVYEYSKKVGYLAYFSFEEVDEDQESGRRNRQALNEVFASFENADIKDLILDLRYNLGGYVETAEFIANQLIGISDDGELMFSYEVNDYLKTAAPYRNNFTDVYFSKKNQLELDNIYILITRSTASAAELLISSLKPYLNVTLIGDRRSSRTYGKPVGFFPEEITDDVTLWATSFKTVNAAGYSDYWDGMDADEKNVDDYIFKDFGDPTEDMIAKALDLAGVSTTSTTMRASARKSSTAQRGVKLGIINKPKERNMLKKNE